MPVVYKFDVLCASYFKPVISLVLCEKHLNWSDTKSRSHVGFSPLFANFMAAFIRKRTNVVDTFMKLSQYTFTNSNENSFGKWVLNWCTNYHDQSFSTTYGWNWRRGLDKILFTTSASLINKFRAVAFSFALEPSHNNIMCWSCCFTSDNDFTTCFTSMFG